MDINSIPPINKTGETDSDYFDEEIETSSVNIKTSSITDLESKQAVDKAAGLLQTIVTDKISDNVIRKMPSDEFSHLLSLLDEIISGSIDKQV